MSADASHAVAMVLQAASFTPRRSPLYAQLRREGGGDSPISPLVGAIAPRRAGSDAAGDDSPGAEVTPPRSAAIDIQRSSGGTRSHMPPVISSSGSYLSSSWRRGRGTSGFSSNASGSTSYSASAVAAAMPNINSTSLRSVETELVAPLPPALRVSSHGSLHVASAIVEEVAMSPIVVQRGGEGDRTPGSGPGRPKARVRFAGYESQSTDSSLMSSDDEVAPGAARHLAPPPSEPLVKRVQPQLPANNTATMASPQLTHEQLKFRGLGQRSAAVVAPPSRPDAPNVEDTLRRVSVVILNHINRGERAALGMTSEREPRASPSAATPPLGGLALKGRTRAHMVRARDDVSEGLLAGVPLAWVWRQCWKRPCGCRRTRPASTAGNDSGAALDANVSDSDSDEDATAAAAALPSRASFARMSDADAFGAFTLTEQEGTGKRAADAPVTLEQMYDAEVMEDAFHESHFLRPQYIIRTASSDFFSLMFPSPHDDVVIRRQRYTFAVPTSADIYTFMSRLYRRAKLTAESSLVALVYVERLMETAKLSLRAHNWRPIVLCGLLLASKVWDDLNSWVVEFAATYPQFTVHAINTMERTFVSAIGFNLYISGSVYARYYFALRALNEQRTFRYKYMNMVGAGAAAAPVAIVKKIEESSKGLREALYSRSL